MTYNFLIDYGKPYKEIFKTEEDVLKKLFDLKQDSEKECYPFFDLTIEKDGKDVTEEIIEKFETQEKYFSVCGYCGFALCVCQYDAEGSLK